MAGAAPSTILCVHCLHRKQENMRFRSEDTSLYLSGWTHKKPAGLFKVCHSPTFGDSLDTSTLSSVHWIWASLYLPSRGHHTSPGKAEPSNYFSSSSTVRVQQQFLQFLILCWLSWRLSVQRLRKHRDFMLATLSAYNHGCYIVLCTLHMTCQMPPLSNSLRICFRDVS